MFSTYDEIISYFSISIKGRCVFKYLAIVCYRKTSLKICVNVLVKNKHKGTTPSSCPDIEFTGFGPP